VRVACTWICGRPQNTCSSCSALSVDARLPHDVYAAADRPPPTAHARSHGYWPAAAPNARLDACPSVDVQDVAWECTLRVVHSRLTRLIHIHSAAELCCAPVPHTGHRGGRHQTLVENQTHSMPTCTRYQGPRSGVCHTSPQAPLLFQQIWTRSASQMHMSGDVLEQRRRARDIRVRNQVTHGAREIRNQVTHARILDHEFGSVGAQNGQRRLHLKCLASYLQMMTGQHVATRSRLETPGPHISCSSYRQLEVSEARATGGRGRLSWVRHTRRAAAAACASRTHRQTM